VSSDAPVLPLLETAEGQRIELVGDGPIAKSSRLVLRGQEWASMERAQDAGSHLADVLALVLVGQRVGVEAWARRPGGRFFAAGLRMLEKQVGQRVLEDSPGLSVYETNPPARFASTGAVTLVRGAAAGSIVASFRKLAELRIELTERERIAIDLFNAAFFETAADTRLLTHVMAIEALLEPIPRPAESVALVEEFLGMVQRSSLSQAERDSLSGSLRWLRQESIRSAGRRLVRERLGEAIYSKQSAQRFFDYCYELRSRIVHGGDIRKARDEAAAAAAQLELFVADLLISRFIRSGRKEDPSVPETK